MPQSQKYGLYAVVHILDVPYHADRPYTYFLPPAMTDTVNSGCFVMVPFGGGNRKTMGLVTELMEREQLPGDFPPELCKPVSKLISAEFVLNAEMLGLCRFLKANTFCTIGEAAKTVIPAGALRKIHEAYEIAEDKTEAFREAFAGMQCPETELYETLLKRGRIRRERVNALFGPEFEKSAEFLVRKGYLRRSAVLSDSENSVYSIYVRAAASVQDLQMLLDNSGGVREKYGYHRRADVYQHLLEKLIALNGRETVLSDLIADGTVTAKAVREMEKSRILTMRREQAYRNPYEEAAKQHPKDDNILSPMQEAARKQLSSLYQTHEPKATLLYGVTGSGKTRVIKAMMDEVIADGRQVIMLVPEISLTPQSVAIFCSYYGDRVAVMHSGLSAGERLDVWRRARRGDVDLVIGTRSAVFSPFEHLGMIVIDEEQEHTYKSDSSPKYHARDAARYRCASDNALLLLASATPSLESYYKAKKGIYSLVELPSRYGHAELPEVIMADLHEDGNISGDTPLGTTLAGALADTCAKEEQAILFINRRGYRRYISCLSCKEPVMCPHCSVPMTLHQNKHQEVSSEGIGGILVCHYCGYRAFPPEECPACHSPHLKAFGYGTQRAEEEILQKFPSMRTLRMDMDTTQGKFAHEKILNSFRNREADILLGTQMVTKGHDFPDVTLVGVLNADSMLYQDDYRASERAFSLITQVIGRAGRGRKKGRAIIQTYNPDNEILRLAAKQDYPAFYEGAIRLRETMIFPPFCDMVLFSLSSKEEVEVMNVSGKLSARIAALTGPDGTYQDVRVVVFGPFEAQVYKVNECFRMRLICKCRMNRRTRMLFADIMQEFSALCGSRVLLGIDINPTNL